MWLERQFGLPIKIGSYRTGALSESDLQFGLLINIGSYPTRTLSGINLPWTVPSSVVTFFSSSPSRLHTSLIAPPLQQARPDLSIASNGLYGMEGFATVCCSPSGSGQGAADCRTLAALTAPAVVAQSRVPVPPPNPGDTTLRKPAPSLTRLGGQPDLPFIIHRGRRPRDKRSTS